MRLILMLPYSTKCYPGTYATEGTAPITYHLGDSGQYPYVTW